MANPTSGLTNSHFIGLSDFYVAPLTSDDDTGAVYGDMIHIPEIVSMQIAPASDTADLYADDQSVDTATTTSKYELTIEMAGLPLEYKAMLLGHTIDKGVMVAKKDDTAPYFGVAFKTMKSNGKFRYMKFCKVKFNEPDENPQTKGENIEFNTPSITANAIYLTHDGSVYRSADEEATDYEATTGTGWFTSF